MSAPIEVFKQYEQETYATYENISGEIIRENDGSLKPGVGGNDALDAYRHSYVSAARSNPS